MSANLEQSIVTIDKKHTIISYRKTIKKQQTIIIIDWFQHFK